MILNIPLQAVPNQFFSTSLNGTTWNITLNTRLDGLYISLATRDGDVLLNRICRDRTEIHDGFVFIDQDGFSDPTYEQLGSRFLLFWGDE